MLTTMARDDRTDERAGSVSEQFLPVVECGHDRHDTTRLSVSVSATTDRRALSCLSCRHCAYHALIPCVRGRTVLTSLRATRRVNAPPPFTYYSFLTLFLVSSSFAFSVPASNYLPSPDSRPMPGMTHCPLTGTTRHPTRDNIRRSIADLCPARRAAQ